MVIASATSRSDSWYVRASTWPERGQRPAVEVAPRLEQAQDPIEAAGERLGAAPDLTPQVLELAADPLGLDGAAQVGVAVGAVGHRVGLRGEERAVVGGGIRRDLRLGARRRSGSRRAVRSASPTWCWKARLFGL